jgi:hypothetical protein
MSAEQLAEGKRLAWSMLEQLAREYAVPLQNLAWEQTAGDFDFLRWSIVDVESKTVVVKLEQDDLEDCPADGGRRAKVEAQLRHAIRSSYARRQTTSG